jgi:hypothetical protein
VHVSLVSNHQATPASPPTGGDLSTYTWPVMCGWAALGDALPYGRSV